jgi:hypothetical protein
MKHTAGVYVVEYNHKHGTDIMVCANEKIARDQIYAIMEEYLFDFQYSANEQQTKDYNDAVKSSNLGKAMMVWGEVLEEGFSYSHCPVIDKLRGD